MLSQFTQAQFGKDTAQCTDAQLYSALLALVKQRQHSEPRLTGDKKLYYISMEFLIGKLLSNNLINLGLYDAVRAELAAAGKSLARIEELEPEPSLGNGGLGRLAACFLDSIATLGLPGDGVGLNYHCGLFRQVFEHNSQRELPDPWICRENWLLPTGVAFDVPFGGFALRSVMYDIDVSGFGGGKNKLHLFDIDTVDPSLVHDGIAFDKADVPHNLTLFLYPDDSDEAGRLLRVYQEYFMVSSAAQLILAEMEQRGFDVRTLAQHAVVQINDTHPSMVIPELIRLLCARGVCMDEAIDIVSHTCAYTNHTILAEALEKWPLAYLQKAVPQLVPVIEELDRRAKAKYPDPAVAIIDAQQTVHMAHMDIHWGFSVNGVAALHTQILKESELRAFYEKYPEKFNNKTNGITFRRWLRYCDGALSEWITGKIGGGWEKNADELRRLHAFEADGEALAQLRAVKQANKDALAAWFARQGIEVDPHSVFDIQIKRLHEYKRQQMNALYVIWKYLEIKAGRLPARPITMIFGAKAAPAYTLAKDIIHLILCLQQLLESDEAVRPWLRVVMVENYNVTKAEKLIPACDISEQISLASKEASGTGNMKFMLNGAVTLGTLDGANVEIRDLVGDGNIYIFGKSSGEVMDLYRERAYDPTALCRDPAIEPLVDFILSGEMLRIGEAEKLVRVYKNLVFKDWFMTLLDVREYIAAKERALADYEDAQAWSRRMLHNIAEAGYFSSDRTIRQYNDEIWHLPRSQNAPDAPA